jgi:hypothetical protein
MRHEPDLPQEISPHAAHDVTGTVERAGCAQYYVEQYERT